MYVCAALDPYYDKSIRTSGKILSTISTSYEHMTQYCVMDLEIHLKQLILCRITEKHCTSMCLQIHKYYAYACCSHLPPVGEWFRG